MIDNIIIIIFQFLSVVLTTFYVIQTDLPIPSLLFSTAFCLTLFPQCHEWELHFRRINCTFYFPKTFPLGLFSFWLIFLPLSFVFLTQPASWALFIFPFLVPWVPFPFWVLPYWQTSRCSSCPCPLGELQALAISCPWDHRKRRKLVSSLWPCWHF